MGQAASCWCLMMMGWGEGVSWGGWGGGGGGVKGMEGLEGVTFSDSQLPCTIQCVSHQSKLEHSSAHIHLYMYSPHTGAKGARGEQMQT